MIANGWTLLFHDAAIGQLAALSAAYRRARRADPDSFRSNANVKLFAALAKLCLVVIPADPGRAEYRQGNTLGAAYRHWMRVKFFGRFRLFYRYDTHARIIVYAWVNDERTLRQRGGRSDPYEIFRRMLATGDPPDEWVLLKARSRDLPADIIDLMGAAVPSEPKPPTSS
ncbi:MAG TPA: type II toxin-antitoxin system YhaV family toxin [Stellaceae bacterium]|nr:type II toxin-antitoxin system YhaV family toxin [Stellaceae bacterium]